MKNQTNWIAVEDRGFSYVHLPLKDGEAMPEIVAANLTPERARLIAAAPELLEALKACALIMERIDDSRLHPADRGPFTGALIEARNAITKAEGAK